MTRRSYSCCRRGRAKWKVQRPRATERSEGVRRREGRKKLLSFRNSVLNMKTHDYEKFANAYAQLEIKDTFYLAYRDIPKLIKKHSKGNKALDFGCGGGRLTRFLKKLGFDTIGIDHSQDMINEAQQIDTEGTYKVIENNKLPFNDSTFDLIFSSIVFMEIPSKQEMVQILKEMKRVLKESGIIIIITDAEDMYKVDWASFVYPDKSNLESGQKVKVIIQGSGIELYDYYWKDKDYKKAFANSDLNVVETHKPLAKGDEPFKWVSETQFPHWIIYVLNKQARP